MNHGKISVLICGVDDAGRGSLVGPLVIAGVSLKKSKIRKLSKMGIRDSKKLTPAAREKLYKKIVEFADSYYVARIYPKTIDKSVENHGLNYLPGVFLHSSAKPDEVIHHVAVAAVGFLRQCVHRCR